MFSEKYKDKLAEYEKFWERKNKNSPIINISYDKDGSVAYRKPKSLEEQWLDEEYVYNAFKHQVENSEYPAEGIPMLFTNFGPGCAAACFGGNFELAENTIWFDRKPVIDDWENPPHIEFDEKSEMWQHMLRHQNKFATDPDINFSIADIGGVLDIVAALRGTENLLYDLYDYPDEVREFSIKVKELWFKVFDKQVEIVKRTGQPINNWMNIPSQKLWYPLQCDFCYMISPAQFEQFVLQDIADQAKYLERSIYHLDGVGELPHLDMILDIPELTGIQWVAGDGQAPLTDEKWFDLYRKIQDKNKNLVLIGGIDENDLAGIEKLSKNINPEGVCINIRCSSAEKAEKVLEKFGR